MGGNFAMDSVATFAWNGWQLCRGMGGNFRVEYALRPGDVLVTDRGLCSYAHLALLAQRGVYAVVRMHQNQIVNFTPGRPHMEPGKRGAKGQKGRPRSRWVRQLGPQDQVVYWLKPATCPQWRPMEQ